MKMIELNDIQLKGYTYFLPLDICILVFLCTNVSQLEVVLVILFAVFIFLNIYICNFIPRTMVNK